MLPTRTVRGPSQGGRTCPLPLHCPVCELCSDGSLPKPLPCLTCQRNQHPHAGVRRSSFNPGDAFPGREERWETGGLLHSMFPSVGSRGLLAQWPRPAGRTANVHEAPTRPWSLCGTSRCVLRCHVIAKEEAGPEPRAPHGLPTAQSHSLPSWSRALSERPAAAWRYL